MLGIPYPGGPLLDKLAEEGDDGRYRFPHTHTPGKYDFSFSGLKTAVINQAPQPAPAGEEISAADFAASFRRAVVDSLAEKERGRRRGGGGGLVGRGGRRGRQRLLRRELARRGGEAGLKVYLPPVALCTDNAAMIVPPPSTA